MDTTHQISLPDNLTKALEALAGETGRTTDYYVQKAVEHYLDEYADLYVSLDRLGDTDDQVITANQLRANLGL